MERCPFDVDIPAKMREAAALLEGVKWTPRIGQFFGDF
jgi:predicted aldo/keto reductase-like oxidoreductase